MPDRVEARVIDRDFVDLRLDRNGPLRFPPFPDFLDRAVDITRRGNDRSLQPVRILPAEIRHVAMEGSDHAGFERDVLDTDQARPAAGHEETHVGPLSSMSATRLAGLSSCTPGRGTFAPIHTVSRPLWSGRGAASPSTRR